MFKIILHFLDNNLYEGAAKLYRLGGVEEIIFLQTCLQKKKEKVIPGALRRHRCFQAPQRPDT